MSRKRFAVMAVPGDLEDGSDTYWFVLDTTKLGTNGASVGTGSGEAGRRTAWQAVYEQNSATFEQPHGIGCRVWNTGCEGDCGGGS